jgi:hypothetical protein
MTASILAGLAGAVTIAASGVYLRYRRDMKAARARLDAVVRRTVSARWGAVEYAELGSGDPVFVGHGIFDNCVGAILSVRDLSGQRLIAPSRFGYLGSNLPLDATPAHRTTRWRRTRRVQRVAGRIPGARFVSLESGGHLMLGQTKRIRDELAGFFAERRERCAEKVAS